MADSGHQTLQQSQSLKLATRLSQQQLRFVRLLEMNAPEIEEAVDQELQSNPALEALPDAEVPQSGAERESDDNTHEEETPSPAWRDSGVSSSSVSYRDIPAPADTPTLYDHLLPQLAEKELTAEELRAARYLTGSLDPNGYLRIPLSQLSLDMAVNEGVDYPDEVWQRALEAVRSLDPAGVGAADLRDTLMLQAGRLPESPERNLALEILGHHFETFALKHYDRLSSLLKTTPEETGKAISLIVQLNPKPGAPFESRASQAANYVAPDFILEERGDEMVIGLANRLPELAIEESFSKAMETGKREGGRRVKKGLEFVADRIGEARDFIKILSQRQQTLLKVATAILKIQKEYFETRDLYRLRPMMLKDIMAITGFDASVVSRATAGKYLQTPWGIFPMRFFFSDTVGENGKDTGALTNRKLEAEIKDLIDKEDKSKPLSDDKLQQAMASRGYDISRRTVAKYRDRLKIPVARLRRKG